MLLYSRYKLILYYTTYIVKNLIVIKAKKQTKKPRHIKYNNSLKSILVRRLSEQRVIQK